MRLRSTFWTRIIGLLAPCGLALTSHAAECTKDTVSRRFGNVSFDHEAAVKAANTRSVEIRNYDQPFKPALCATVVRALDRIGQATTGKLRYFLVQSLKLEGSPISGLFRGDDLVLLAYYPHDNNGLAEFERVIYHETSSYVYRQNPELRAEWDALHDRQMVAGGCAFHGDQWYFGHPDEGNSRAAHYRACGVLIGYGASNAENDFNTYAEDYFMDLDGLRRLAQSNAAVAKKLALFFRFYPAGR